MSDVLYNIAFSQDTVRKTSTITKEGSQEAQEHVLTNKLLVIDSFQRKRWHDRQHTWYLLVGNVFFNIRQFTASRAPHRTLDVT